MLTAYEVRSRAVYEAARILSNGPDGLPFKELWARILSAYPELEADSVATQGEGFVSPDRRLRLDSINLRKAGWLLKSNRRWRLTGLGRLALSDELMPEDLFLDPRPEALSAAVQFFDVARRRYYYWKSHRDSF